jgi:regulator of nonsense transcripts 1
VSIDLPGLTFRATSAQTTAVDRAVTQGVTLIQGPPGCGKTAVIAAIVYTLLSNPGVVGQQHSGRILVCGTSNVSVENLVRALLPVMQGLNKSLIWVATKSQDVKPSPNLAPECKVQLYQHLLKRKTEEGQAFQDLERASWRRPLSDSELRQQDKLQGKLEPQLCKEADVVCCTLESAARKCLAELRFPIVIMDEATQAVESSALIPLIHHATKMVLVGDQKQLGPVVSLAQLKSRKYDRSLFDRLIEQGVAPEMLDLQFRMHPDISRFPSKHFYQDKLRDGISADQRQSPPLDCFPVPKVPLSFVTISHDEESIGTSFANSAEADAVRNVIHMMLNGGVDEGHIGVISPYRSQIAVLRRMFPRLRFPRLKIASVDSFQGSERDYIVMSCVRSKDVIGFLDDKRRLNVSITRARRGLVIVGNSSTLSRRSPKWSSLVGYYQSKKVLQSTIAETPLIARPDPDKEPGIDLPAVTSCLTGEPVQIVWPDTAQNSSALADWVEARQSLITPRRFVTIALDVDSSSSGPVSIKLGEIGTSPSDPLLQNKFFLNSTTIEVSDALVVFCKTRTATTHCVSRRFVALGGES